MSTLAKCSYFGVCGGCTYQDLPYELQLERKQKDVQDVLQLTQVLPVIASPKKYHYRHSISLSIKKREGKPRFGFIGKDKLTFIPVESCAIADERLNQYMPTAHERLMALPGKKPFRTSQVMLRAGDYPEVVTSLREDRKKRLECTVNGKRFTYAVSSFFQHNASILTDFVAAIGNLLSSSTGHAKTLVDLYSGVGLFGISLAAHYDQVIGIEEGYESVQLAKENAAFNSVLNATFQQGRVEELIQGIDYPSETVDVIVDPPRKGLKREVIDVLKLIPVKKLIYVSCSLEALKRDLELLTDVFEIEQIQPIDLFPQTHHIETIVLLNRKRA